MPTISPRLAVVVIAAIVRAAPAQTVRDSAGVRIVENARPSLPVARTWRLAPTPLVDIGTTSGDSLYELSLVMGVARLRDGTIAVANQATGTIRFFDPTGRYLRAAGRPGQGPGEFRQILGLQGLRADTLLAIDLMGVKYYTGAGVYLRDGASRTREPRVGFPSAVLSNGAYVGFGIKIPQRGRMGRWLDSNTVFRVSADGAHVDSIARFPSFRAVAGPESPGGDRLVFGARPQFAGADSGFYFAFPERYVVDYYASGGAQRLSVRRPVDPRSVSRDAIAAYKDVLTKLPGEDGRPASPEQRARIAAFADRVAFAERFPVIAQLRVDAAQNLWVNRYEPWVDMPRTGRMRTFTSDVVTVWDVFDPQGRWLTTVTMPAHFAPLEIGADYVAGLFTDADDVEHVRLYRLAKS